MTLSRLYRKTRDLPLLVVPRKRQARPGELNTGARELGLVLTFMVT